MMGQHFWAAMMAAKRNGGKVGQALYEVLGKASDAPRSEHEVNSVLVEIEGMVRSIRNGLDADRMGGTRGNANW